MKSSMEIVETSVRLTPESALEISNTLRQLLADVFALYLKTHEICERHSDVATASLIETWIDEAERRTWFLSEIVRER